MFNATKIFFYFLSLVDFFIMGMILAALTNAGEGQGLAAGAIVLSYGVASGFIMFIISIIGARYLSEIKIKLFNKILLILLLIFVLLFIYRISTQ